MIWTNNIHIHIFLRHQQLRSLCPYACCKFRNYAHGLRFVVVWFGIGWFNYADIIMTTMTSQITSLTVVYSIVYSDADQGKHQRSGSPAFAGNSPVTGEFPALRASNTKNVAIWWRHHANRMNKLKLIIYWQYMINDKTENEGPIHFILTADLLFLLLSNSIHDIRVIITTASGSVCLMTLRYILYSTNVWLKMRGT